MKVYLFSYCGGVVKLSEHVNEKFLLFFLIGDKEIPLYQMLRDGLAQRVDSGGSEYLTKYDCCKLFVCKQGFGMAKQYHSFYILLGESYPTMTILPISGEQIGFSFKAKSKIMTREEVLKRLPDGMESKKFFIRQEVLPVNVMQKMVFIDRSELKSGVRHIKVGKGKEE